MSYCYHILILMFLVSQHLLFIHYSSDIFVLSLVDLCSLTNIIFYLVSILFIKYYNLSDRYPIMSRFLSYFEYNSLFWIIVEFIIGYSSLVAVLIFSLLYLGKTLF
uniref:Uncharacterized protein n=1 Tax=Tricholoma bakamatsutake TaxID=51221 RepID=A0A6C0W3N1_9AGAR|nr:hypothetical protein [Tricholoma bakamatsutake]QIC20218.1 hypothetical protein [Tricholoma bakamatsutake]